MKKIVFICLCLFITSCNDEQGVVTEIKACDSSVDANCQSSGNLDNDVVLHVEERFVSHSSSKSSSSTSCDSGFIYIPHGKKSFCVSRDESINENRLKVRVSSIEEAEGYCNSQGHFLIQHDQWMRIAEMMREHKLNYSLGKDSAFLNSRELFVQGDQSLVNFVTGQPEWVAWSDNSLTMPSECVFNSSESQSSEKVQCQGNFLGAVKNQGQVFEAIEFKSQPKAMLRSGSLAKHKKALYHAYIGNTPSKNSYGVRCTYEK